MRSDDRGQDLWNFWNVYLIEAHNFVWSIREWWSDRRSKGRPNLLMPYGDASTHLKNNDYPMRLRWRLMTLSDYFHSSLIGQWPLRKKEKESQSESPCLLQMGRTLFVKGSDIWRASVIIVTSTLVNARANAQSNANAKMSLSHREHLHMRWSK